jgi:sodium-dependent phosphate cotransporter
LFLIAIKALGHALQMLGKESLGTLIGATDNPFVGLAAGILVTSIIQSSSTTTSIVVGLVGSGQMGVVNAVPIVMGANIGTTVTNTIVALSTIGRREEFRRAMSAATMHDFFNVLTVILLFPLELGFRLLSRSAEFATSFVQGLWTKSYESPLQELLNWASHTIEAFCSAVVAMVGIANVEFWAAILMGIVSLGLIFVALFSLVKLLKSLMLKRVEILLDRYLGGTGVLALAIGVVVTALVQSSSVTTSTLVPLVAAGVLQMERAFPITLGANLGTTVTALIASVAADLPAGLTIALAHFLFNLLGILVFFPFPRMRSIPIGLAKWIGEVAYRSRARALSYSASLFFGLPTLLIILWEIFHR